MFFELAQAIVGMPRGDVKEEKDSDKVELNGADNKAQQKKGGCC